MQGALPQDLAGFGSPLLHAFAILGIAQNPPPKKVKPPPGRTHGGPGAVWVLSGLRLRLLLLAGVLPGVPDALPAVDGAQDAPEGGQVDVVAQPHPVDVPACVVPQLDIGHGQGV